MEKSKIKMTINELTKRYDIHDESIKVTLEVINSADAPERLSDMAFIIITPDSIYNQKAADIVDYICNKTNCKVIAAKLKYLNDFEIEELYRYTYQSKIKINEPTFWWLTRRSYQNTPCIALLLYNPQHEYEHFCQTLVEIKGSYAIKNDYKGETIRDHFNAVTRILAVVHSSDDVLSLMREARLFFDNKELLNILNSTHSNKFIGSDIIRDLTIPNVEGNIIETMQKRLQATLKIIDMWDYYLKTSQQIISNKEINIPLLDIGETIRKANIYLSEWDEIYLINKLYFKN